MIRPHHQELLLTCDQNHVATDRLAESAFDEEALGEAIELDYFLVVYIRKLINREKTLFGIEGEVTSIVVCEVKRSVAVTNHKELKKAKDRLRIAISGIVLVIDDLLHGATGAYANGF